MVDLDQIKDGTDFIADIRGRFTNSNSSCTISSYRISHVQNSNGINLTDTEILNKYYLTFNGRFAANLG